MYCSALLTQRYFQKMFPSFHTSVLVSLSLFACEDSQGKNDKKFPHYIYKMSEKTSTKITSETNPFLMSETSINSPLLQFSLHFFSQTSEMLHKKQVAQNNEILMDYL